MTTTQPTRTYHRIVLCRDEHELEIEEVTPTDGVSIMPKGPTFWQATVPVPVDQGGQMPVTVVLEGATSLHHAFQLLHTRDFFLPRLQAAAQAKGEKIRALQAKGPRIVAPVGPGRQF